MENANLEARPDDPHCIRMPSEILGLLRNILRGQRPILLTLQKKLRIPTVLLDVDEDSGHFIYDHARTPEEARAVLSSSRIFFNTTLDGVTVRFAAPAARETAFAGAAAFFSPFPAEIHYQQRRQHYRAKIKILQPYRCTARLPGGAAIQMQMDDLSLGGTNLRSTAIPPEMLPNGTLLPGAVLDFLDLGKVEVKLRVVSHRRMENDGLPIYFYGCQFQALPRANEALLQRIVFSLELLGRRR